MCKDRCRYCTVHPCTMCDVKRDRSDSIARQGRDEGDLMTLDGVMDTVIPEYRIARTVC